MQRHPLAAGLPNESLQTTTFRETAGTRANADHANALVESRKSSSMNWPTWDLDEKVWPKKRDFHMLTSWFEVQVSSMVLDLGDDEIEVEEFDV